MCWENINTEQRERKIYGRLIYIHELSSITKEIIKQDESVFKSFIGRSSYKVSPDWLNQTIGNNRLLKIQNGGR